jgi:hypothetical protein
VGPVRDVGQHERHPALGGGDALQPPAQRGHQRVVEAGHLVQHLQGVLRRDGLAGGAPQVGLQGVAEPAVRVLVRAQRGHDRVRRPVQEQVREAVAVQQPPVAPDEVRRPWERGVTRELLGRPFCHGCTSLELVVARRHRLRAGIDPGPALRGRLLPPRARAGPNASTPPAPYD